MSVVSDSVSAPAEQLRFDQLGLAAPILQALEALGYETPSPIQAACIPLLMAGNDILGEAQTGTGKTAAFALPVLAQVDIAKRKPQVLVLAPTRELAIQVAEAFQSYARNLPGFHVLPLYGGQSMVVQLRQLERGAHVIVGTPGRVMDHIERKSLNLEALKTLVLDEADEMLRMGFIDDVEWILEHTPATRQTALFSATMPDAIRRVARTHLREPKEVKIKAATSTVTTIRQRYWQVTGTTKLDAMTRMLEVEEDFDAAIVFARTKTATVELAEKLEARGYAAAALNGDMQQAQRERVIEQLKNKQLDIVVATDVAARGIDVPRISHVINYDIPYDTEAYVHRIGRTGRAGRTGTAILFVAPREKRMLRIIEQATRQPIEPMKLPSAEAVADRRVAQFKQQVVSLMGEGEHLGFMEDVVKQIVREQGVEPVEVAAALAYLVQRERPLQPQGYGEQREFQPREQREFQAREPREPREFREPRQVREYERPARESRSTAQYDSPSFAPAPVAAPVTEIVDHKTVGPGDDPNDPWAEARRLKKERKAAEAAEKLARGETPRAPWRDDKAYNTSNQQGSRPTSFGKTRYRIAVGRDEGVSPKDIVGAIANEAGIESRHIGQINLFQNFSTVELPDSLPEHLINLLRRVRVRGKAMDLEVDTGPAPAPRGGFGGDRGERGDFRPRGEGGFRRDFGDRNDRGDRGGDRGGFGREGRGDFKGGGFKREFSRDDNRGENRGFGDRGGFNRDRNAGGERSGFGDRGGFKQGGFSRDRDAGDRPARASREPQHDGPRKFGDQGRSGSSWGDKPSWGKKSFDKPKKRF